MSHDNPHTKLLKTLQAAQMGAEIVIPSVAGIYTIKLTRRQLCKTENGKLTYQAEEIFDAEKNQ